MKVALDTNVLVSAVATRGLCADLFRAVLARHQLVAGETVLTELRRVLQQMIRLHTDTIGELETFLRKQAIVADAAPARTVRVRDQSDVAVLAEAIGGGADVLVTGDQDLLEIAAESPIPILTPRGLWDRIRSNP